MAGKKESNLKITSKADDMHQIVRKIYIGPSSSKLGLRRYTTFTGGVPAVLAELIKTEPLINQLLIDKSEFAAKLKAMKDPTRVEVIAFNKMTSLLVLGGE